MTTRKLYSKEFKLDAISLSLEQGYSRAPRGAQSGDQPKHAGALDKRA
jgi:transposase-like protein